MSTQQTSEAQNSKAVKFQAPLLLDHEYGTEVPAPDTFFEPEDLYVGNVLTIKDQGGKRHYLIKRVEDGDPKRVYISPGKSNLRWVFLLLAILAGVWFFIDYVFGWIFS